MKARLLPLIAALAAGGLYPLGFAPFGWWPLALVSVMCAFMLWERLSGRLLYGVALAYGLGLYLAGVSWVYVSMVNFGNMLPLMAVLAVCLFALYLSLYFPLMLLVYTRLSPRLSRFWRLTALLPSLWVGAEALRGALFTGFAWLYLGYAGTSTWFAGWASLGGVLTVSFVLAWVAGLAVYLLTGWRQARRLDANGKLGLLGLLVLLGLSFLVSRVDWAEPDGTRVETSLVQADISLAEKWRPENREQLVETYLAASAAIADAELIVWPEAALPMVLEQVPAGVRARMRALGASLVFGVVDRQIDAGEPRLYNGLAAIDKQAGASQAIQVYHKRHLVPFGEFFPLQPVLGWLFESLEIPMSDFASGPREQPLLRAAGLRLVPTICYEDAYPEDWRHQVPESNAILNVSEDAWFGDSLGPHQRLQMARMRAIEFQRPVIRVSNNGLSTIIDDRGRVDAISPQFEPALFSAPVFGMRGVTPYTRYGSWPLWGFIFGLLGVLLARSVKWKGCR